MNKWGYKGTETSVNGLIKWLIKNCPLKGASSEGFDKYYRIIVDFATANIDGFSCKGRLHTKADAAAKAIQRHYLFQKFTLFAKTKKYEQDKSGNN